MVLLEVHDGVLAEDFSVEPAVTGGWRLLTPCDGDPVQDRDSVGQLLPLTPEQLHAVCPLLREGLNPEGSVHVETFLALMDLVLARISSGVPLREVFNGKQMHEVGERVVELESGKKEPARVIQFEKQGTRVRVLWLYARSTKTLLLTHVFIKPGGKLKTTPPQQVDRAASIFEGYVLAHAAGTARLISQQGGRKAYEQL